MEEVLHLPCGLIWLPVQSQRTVVSLCLSWGLDNWACVATKDAHPACSSMFQHVPDSAASSQISSSRLSSFLPELIDFCFVPRCFSCNELLSALLPSCILPCMSKKSSLFLPGPLIVEVMSQSSDFLCNDCFQQWMWHLQNVFSCWVYLPSAPLFGDSFNDCYTCSLQKS